MPTKINLDTQTDAAEFSAKVSSSISNTGAAKTTIAQFTEFDTTSGHDHDGVNSKKVSWTNIDAKPASFTPAPHDHNSHTNIGPDDHHNHLSAGYDIIPNSVAVDDFVELKNNSILRFGTAADNINASYENQILTIKSPINATFIINNSVQKTYIHSSEIYIGDATSTVNFSSANIEADNWNIDGQGYAQFKSINDIILSPVSQNNNISGVDRFNGVHLEATGTFSGLKVGNNLYQINHSSHAQNTDIGTNQTTFTINYSQQNNIKISADITTTNASEVALVNDIETDKALILIGNSVRDGVNKKVRVYDDLEVQGKLITQDAIVAFANQQVATYHPQDGTIKDNYGNGHIQIGYTLIQWGISSGADWRSITFNKSFANGTTPSVSCSAADSSEAIGITRNITNEGFEINGVDDNKNSISCNLTWIAIGISS